MNFKDIPFAPSYSVTDDGIVARRDRLGNLRQLKPVMDPWGYYSVNLYIDKKPKRFKIHRLVMLTWGTPVPNEGKNICRHLNDNPIDNRIANLAWGDCADNYRDKVLNHRKEWIAGEMHYNQKLNPQKVLDILKRLQMKQTVRSVAHFYGVAPSTIEAIKRGISWKHLNIALDS